MARPRGGRYLCIASYMWLRIRPVYDVLQYETLVFHLALVLEGVVEGHEDVCLGSPHQGQNSALGEPVQKVLVILRLVPSSASINIPAA